MIQNKYLVIAVCLSALFISPLAHAEPKTKHKPQLYDYSGSPVSPLCFLNNFGTEEAPIYPSSNCQHEDIVNVGESPFRDDYIGVSYEESYYDVETDESSSTIGFVAYRAAGVTDEGLIGVITLENGGGSGTFSTLRLLDPVRDEKAKTLNYVEKDILAFGDRCMGGVANAWIEDGQLRYSQHVTMTDMMGLIGDPERPILQSEAAMRLPVCAACCYGEATYAGDALQSITFTPNRHKPDAGNEAGRCTEDLIALNEKHGQTTFSAEDFGYLLDEIEHTCLGRTASE